MVKGDKVKINYKFILSCIFIIGLFAIGAIALPYIIPNENTSPNYVSGTMIDGIPVNYLRNSYIIDVNNPAELVGDADYVFVARVDNLTGTTYRFPSMVIDDNGKDTEVTTPFTNYQVTIIQNIKGELVSDRPISLQKKGGISKDKKMYTLPEGDFLPEEGKIYIFFAYAQEDGSLLVSGRNSVIDLNRTNLDKRDLNNELTMLNNNSEYLSFQKAYENQIVRNRDRFISIYDVNFKQ